MKRPIIGITCAYALGIAFAAQIQMPDRTSSLLFLLLLFLLLLGFIAWGYLGPKKLLGLILSAFFALGIILYDLHAHPPSPLHLANLPPDFLEGPILLEGTICTPPEALSPTPEGDDRVRLVLDQIILFGEKNARATQGRARIFLPEPEDRFRYGERIRLPVQLRRPRGYLNPGGFCLSRYLQSEGIYLEGRGKSEGGLLRLGRFGKPALLEWLYDLRQRMLQQMQRTIAPPYHGLLQAITLGDRSLLDHDLQEAFVRSGTYHILAISGLNITMVAGVLYFLLRLLRFPLRLRAVLTILWVILYAFLAGGSPSVVRAAIMTSLFLGALLLEREADLLNTLALSAFLILLWNPSHLLEAGFQLTFGATFGILFLMQVLPPPFLPRPGRWLLNSLMISLAATLATLPLLAHHFHRASLIGILANLPIVPLSGLITALGLIFAFLSLFLFSGLHWLAQLLQILIALMARLAHFFSLLPGASLLIYGPSMAMIVLYYGFLISACQWAKGRWTKISAIICLCLLLSLIGVKLYHLHHRTDLRVTFLDVGQGDCALLELPSGKAVLIDGGGSRQGDFDVGEQVVRPYLLHRWVGRLDRLISSHPHPDHLKGLFSILNGFPVGEAWQGKGPEGSPLSLEFRSLLQQKGIPLHPLGAGEVLKEPPLEYRILHPSPPYLRGSRRGAFSDENNNSLVLRIRFGEISLLFAGDIEAEAEARILRQRPHFPCQVIKIPHHGGRNSSTPPFIRAVHPALAIASAGPFNPFGHPSPETVRRYEKAGARVLQTSRDGAIILVTDGKALRVSTEREERRGRRNLWLNWLGWD